MYPFAYLTTLILAYKYFVYAEKNIHKEHRLRGSGTWF